MTNQNLFFSLNNPIIFSILLSFALLGLIYVLYVHVIIPLQRKHFEEKESLELQNARLMALFAELDPDPVFRFDKSGTILIANKAGVELFIINSSDENHFDLSEAKVKTIFPQIAEMNFGKLISESLTYHFSAKIKNNSYDIMIKGISEMEFGQIYCHNITERIRAEEELVDSRKKLRELSNHMHKLQEEEKQKLSRELHDSLGQILTTIRLNLELLKKESNEDRDTILKIIKDMSSLLDNAMGEVKEISYRLKPRILDDFGLIPSLKLLCNDISYRSGVKGEFYSYKFETRLNPDVETSLYRIAQEALNNIVKHSHATEFSLQLVKHPEFLRMMIEDNGIGFEDNEIKSNQSKRNSMGLVNMQERVLSFSGKLIIDSRKGGGTEIIIEVPLEEQDD
jgi:signal transduction histidine kinase